MVMFHSPSPCLYVSWAGRSPSRPRALVLCPSPCPRPRPRPPVGLAGAQGLARRARSQRAGDICNKGAPVPVWKWKSGSGKGKVGECGSVWVSMCECCQCVNVVIVWVSDGSSSQTTWHMTNAMQCSVDYRMNKQESNTCSSCCSK